ncbi:cell division protein ZapA [Bacillaceae bacterium S4-13-58]
MANSEKTRITVEIHNNRYTVVGDESAHHVRMVASLVDDKMHQIQEANPSLDTAKLAVLTAVNTMSDYMKLKEAYQQLLESKQKDEEK